MKDLSLQQLNAEQRMLVAIYGDKALRIKDEPYDFPIPNNHFDLTNIVATLNGLDPYSQEVVRVRFGLGESEPKSVFEVADELGLSPSRVLDVINRSLKIAHISTMSDEEARAFYFLQTLHGFKERVVMGNYLSSVDQKTDQEISRLTQLTLEQIAQIREQQIPRWNSFEISELD